MELTGYGITTQLLPGWEGRITKRSAPAATAALPVATTTSRGRSARRDSARSPSTSTTIPVHPRSYSARVTVRPDGRPVQIST